MDPIAQIFGPYWSIGVVFCFGIYWIFRLVFGAVVPGDKT
jgi:hypothetical protein